MNDKRPTYNSSSFLYKSCIFEEIVAIRLLLDMTTSLEECESYNAGQIEEILKTAEESFVSKTLTWLENTIPSSIRMGQSVQIIGAR